MSSSTRQQRSRWPGYWFLRLEAAIERGDYLSAAEAQRRLERLGVDVTYRAAACATRPAGPGEAGK